MENLEPLESLEGMDSPFTLDEYQQEAVDLELQRAGGEELVANGEMDKVVEAYDKAIEMIKPGWLRSAANLSPMKGFSQTWTNLIDQYLESHYLEAFTDKKQVEYISDYMSGIEEIRFENWKELSLDQQVEILNKMEQQIAKIEHRPAAHISAEHIDDADFGYQLGDDIVINTTYLEIAMKDPAMLDNMLETLIHEGRHRYQHYNVEDRLVHESPAEVESWRENFEVLGYSDGSPVTIHIAGPFEYTDPYLTSVGARLYYYQPVEIDARNFAADVMKELHKKWEA